MIYKFICCRVKKSNKITTEKLLYLSNKRNEELFYEKEKWKNMYIELNIKYIKLMKQKIKLEVPDLS